MAGGRWRLRLISPLLHLFYPCIHAHPQHPQQVAHRAGDALRGAPGQARQERKQGLCCVCVDMREMCEHDTNACREKENVTTACSLYHPCRACEPNNVTGDFDLHTWAGAGGDGRAGLRHGAQGRRRAVRGFDTYCAMVACVWGEGGSGAFIGLVFHTLTNTHPQPPCTATASTRRVTSSPSSPATSRTRAWSTTRTSSARWRRTCWWSSVRAFVRLVALSLSHRLALSIFLPSG